MRHQGRSRRRITTIVAILRHQLNVDYLRAGNISLFTIACTPQLPSTTCVTPKSTATDMSDTASSSLRCCVFIRKCRILWNASRKARSTEDFLNIWFCASGPKSFYRDFPRSQALVVDGFILGDGI